MNLKATLKATDTLRAKQSIGGKGGGASDWGNIKNKPFETLGDDFTVENGELQLADNYATEEYVDNAVSAITPFIPVVSATSTLSTGTQIGSITIDGETTTFFAPSGGSGVQSVSYEDLTSGTGTQIGTLRVDNADYYVYAPSGGGGSVNIDNKSLIEVNGILQEAVPIYSEQQGGSGTVYGPGLYGDSFTNPGGIVDLDFYFTTNNFLTLATNLANPVYKCAIRFSDNTIFDAYWDATSNGSYIYGGGGRYDGQYELYIDQISITEYRLHIWMSGDSRFDLSTVEELCLYQTEDVSGFSNITNQVNEVGQIDDSYTVYHQLPAEYVPIDNVSIYNDNGVLKAASGTQANWSESDSSSPAYIQNKPTIPQADNTTIIDNNGIWSAVGGGGGSYQGKNGVNVSNSVISLNSDINAFGGVDFGYGYIEQPLKDGTGKVSNYIGGGIIKTTSNDSTDDIRYTNWPRLNLDGTLSTRKEVWASYNFVNDTAYRKVQTTTPYYKYYNNEWFGPYYITGMFIGEYDPNSTPTYNIRIEGWESILDSITWDGNNLRYVFTFKDDICINPVEQDVPFPFVFVSGVNDIPDPQKVNAYFLPVDDNTIKVNSDGEIYAVGGGGSTDWNDITNKPNFATVATSGSYSDLSNTPTIPTAVSQLTNDSNFATETYVNSATASIPTGSVVGITNTLQTGTAIADIDIDGITTTLYAPAGGGGSGADWTATSGQSGYISNKPSIYAGVGTNAIREGTSTRADGDSSHAEGNNTYANGRYSHAEGSVTQADGQASHSEGMNTYAEGNYSHAEGNGTSTYDEASHAQGKFNVYEPFHYADMVGNGTSSSNRSNAEATDWNGNKYLAGDVYVGVTNWTTPTLGATKLARIPAPPTNVDDDYTLHAGVVNGEVSYYWVGTPQ